ncbi:hypothetical protein Mucpa_2978 [Mucilaginibacter paludis DSM 18603]|uniref:Uncharacterized protein n=1 Tax=Mucilaginibacter paludis DSM 18603 TaxID=714943 RepID=H1YC07_9SPHI|nr:hypothetical protein Mucpa_2978 [Mucilaginibacter paludis DSM 18603]
MFNWGNKLSSFYNSPGITNSYFQTTRMQNIGFSLVYGFGKIKATDDDLVNKKAESKKIKKSSL